MTQLDVEAINSTLFVVLRSAYGEHRVATPTPSVARSLLSRARYWSTVVYIYNIYMYLYMSRAYELHTRAARCLALPRSRTHRP